MNNPLVSIIIPVYNGSNYMREAIDSALNQTYKNIEILVVNDGSNDNGKTEEIALSYGDKIRYFKKTNGGVSTALNLGIKNMRGEYFSWLSHDDVYAPQKIESQINILSEYKDKNLIALCGHSYIDSKSKPISQINKKRFETGKIIQWNSVLYDLLLNGSFQGCAFLIPKSVFDRCSGFDESLRYSQDVLMWINIFSNKFSLVYNSKNYVYGRIHDKQLTQTGSKIFKNDGLVLCDKVLQRLIDLSTKDFNFVYAYAHRAALHGDYDVVKRCLDASAQKKLLPLKLKLNIHITLLYGKVRPFIRKIYYQVFRNIKPS